MSRFTDNILGRKEHEEVPEALPVWLILPFLGIFFSAFLNLLLALLNSSLSLQVGSYNLVACLGFLGSLLQFLGTHVGSILHGYNFLCTGTDTDHHQGHNS